MHGKPERWAAYTGVLAVVLWVVGVLLVEGAGSPPDSATDAEVLANYKDDANVILTGGWIFMVGSLAFLCFAVVLRQRLAAAEGGSRLFSNIAFVGAAATGAFGLLLFGPSIAAAIDKDNLSEASAAAMNTLGDAFFVAAELSAILLVLGAGVVALRTGVLPKAWAWFSLLLAVVLVIGPIGWAGLIFGLPIWVLGTTFFLARSQTTTVPQSVTAPS
jgi:hypothetical protein